jgi:hypothetical protein
VSPAQRIILSGETPSCAEAAMKQHASEPIGYYVGFLSLLAKPRSPEEPIQAKFSSRGPCPVDRYETGSVRRQVAKHLVQIGVIALDYRPDLPRAGAPIASSGRRSLGPVRIIASVG